MFGEGKLLPKALHIVDKYIYVCDFRYVVVYETSGQFVASFGGLEGEFNYPHCITSCANGFIHVCDRENNRIQIF